MLYKQRLFFYLGFINRENKSVPYIKSEKKSKRFNKKESYNVSDLLSKRNSTWYCKEQKIKLNKV